MRTNKGCLKLLYETGTQAVSEMDTNTREGRETPTKKVQNSKLPSGMTSRGKRIKQICFPPKRQIIAADGQTWKCQGAITESSDQTAQFLHF